MPISELTEETDEIQRVSFGIHFSTTERIKLRFMKAPRFPRDCSLAIRKLDNGTFQGIIEEDDMSKLLRGEGWKKIDLGTIPSAAAKVILEKYVALLAQSPIGAKASASGEMRMFVGERS